ncbi:hypothetical protein DYI42_16830 [Vannielia litorea]|nr:hypothetical protein [Vannielia litorea]
MTMDDRPDREDGAAGGVPPATEQLLARGVGALVTSIGQEVERAETETGLLLEEMRYLRRVLLAAYQEKEIVEEHQKRGGGGGRAGDRDTGERTGGGVLDLDTARAEIGRRLARLRAAGDAGELPGEPER